MAQRRRRCRSRADDRPGDLRAALGACRKTAAFFALFGAVCAAVPGRAAPAEADVQEWNETDLSAKITDDFMLTSVSELRFGTLLKNPARYEIGLDGSFVASPHLVLTASYRYVANRDSAGKLDYVQSPFVAATLMDTIGSWTFSDRNRLMSALGGGQDSWIYRNRPRIDYAIEGNAFSVFMWDEFFYRSQYERWTRNRLGAGARIGITEGCAVELYYLRQEDNSSYPHTINGLGVTLDWDVLR